MIRLLAVLLAVECGYRFLPRPEPGVRTAEDGEAFRSDDGIESKFFAGCLSSCNVTAVVLNLRSRPVELRTDLAVLETRCGTRLDLAYWPGSDAATMADVDRTASRRPPSPTFWHDLPRGVRLILQPHGFAELTWAAGPASADCAPYIVRVPVEGGPTLTATFDQREARR